MKTFKISKLVIATTAVCTALLSGSALAEYKLTAFGYTTGFTDLLSQNADAAGAAFEKRSIASLDYLELNNLCVTKIMLEEFAAAQASCASALQKTGTASDVSYLEAKAVKAAILSNLAVARALSGDLPSAQMDLETALSLNSRDSNAKGNYAVIAAKNALAELALSGGGP